MSQNFGCGETSTLRICLLQRNILPSTATCHQALPRYCMRRACGSSRAAVAVGTPTLPRTAGCGAHTDILHTLHGKGGTAHGWEKSCILPLNGLHATSSIRGSAWGPLTYSFEELQGLRLYLHWGCGPSSQGRWAAWAEQCYPRAPALPSLLQHCTDRQCHWVLTQGTFHPRSILHAPCPTKQHQKACLGYQVSEWKKQRWPMMKFFCFPQAFPLYIKSRCPLHKSIYLSWRNTLATHPTCVMLPLKQS